MALRTQPEVDLSGIVDPQRPVTVAVGVWLIVVGIAGLTGVLDLDLGFGEGLVLGLFGVPLWLGVTAVVAGLLGLWMARYAGAATTFNKLAAGLVLPIVGLLAVADWAIAVGGLALVLAVVAFLLAGVGVAVGMVLLFKLPVSLVLPVVAVLTLADWLLGLTATVGPTEPVNPATVVLLVLHVVLVGLIAFEGGSRVT